MKPVIVSFHTGEDRYVEDAKRLVESAHKFGYEIHLEVIESDLNWVKSASLKSSYIKSMIDKIGPKPVLWIDSDGEIRRPLEILHNPYFNLGLTWIKGAAHFQGGTVYFNLGDPLAVKFLDRWVDVCREIREDKRKGNDQTVLMEIWDSMDRIPITRVLPQGYVKVFDHGWKKGVDQVEYIRHHQASREIRKFK